MASKKQTITVKLTDAGVSIDPPVFEVEYGANQKIRWQRKDKSRLFDFADPAITFRKAAPIAVDKPGAHGVDASDNNLNESGQPVAYQYQVHLIDDNNNKIVYPDDFPRVASFAASANFMDPTIINRPKKI